LILLFALAPFIWVLNVSLTPESGLFGQKISYFPANPTLDNYSNIFKVVNFGKAFLNSTIVASITTILASIVSFFAGYAFARFRFPGRQALIISLLLIYMLPGIVLLLPMLVIFKSLGLINTYQGLIIAECTQAIPYSVWMLTNYISTLPRELEDSGLVDGCNRLQTMLLIILPLALPGIVVTALFVFIGSWNNFLFAFMFTSGEEVRTLPVVLRAFVGGETGVYWPTIMAGTVMTTLPVALAFLFFQRYLIQGLAAGAVKG
jgi:ABC-type glycerol-3-phosphate transport system permease component